MRWKVSGRARLGVEHWDPVLYSYSRGRTPLQLLILRTTRSLTPKQLQGPADRSEAANAMLLHEEQNWISVSGESLQNRRVLRM